MERAQRRGGSVEGVEKKGLAAGRRRWGRGEVGQNTDGREMEVG